MCSNPGTTLDSLEEPLGRAKRCIVASISFDGLLEPARADARGATVLACAETVARQLVLRTEEFDIQLRIWGEPGHRQMLGQVLSRNEERFLQVPLHLLRSSETLETVVVDKMGEFRFADVPDDDLTLQVDLPDLTIIGLVKVKRSSLFQT